MNEKGATALHVKATVMRTATAKLPDRDALRGHLDSGMSKSEIAESYGCTMRALEDTLRILGLSSGRKRQPPVDGPRRDYVPPPARERVEVGTDRIVYVKLVSVGYTGGNTLQRISVPYTTMHAAHLHERAKACGDIRVKLSLPEPRRATPSGPDQIRR